MQNTKIFEMSFASVYPHYITKVEKKWHSKQELDTLIFWLTWYDKTSFQQQLDNQVDFQTFFAQAPEMNPNRSQIKWVICWYRVEDIEDELMQKIRQLDKIVDELAKWKSMDKILRK